MKCEIVEGGLVQLVSLLTSCGCFKSLFFSFSTPVVFIPSINGEGQVTSVCDPPVMFTACSSLGIQLIHFLRFIYIIDMLIY